MVSPPTLLRLATRRHELPQHAKQAQSLGQPGPVTVGAGDLVEQTLLDQILQVLVRGRNYQGRIASDVLVQLLVDGTIHVVAAEVAVDDTPGQ